MRSQHRHRRRDSLVAVLGSIILTATIAPAFPTSASAASPGPVLRPGDKFHIQLSGRLRVPRGAKVVEVDGETTSARQVRALHRRRLKVVCYVSAGTWESYRRDAKRFPRGVLGRALPDWPDERWLDVRRHARLRPIMAARVRACALKGFDGIEFDNVDGYSNRTGFPISRRHQIRYDLMLARLARDNGLSPGLKNAVDLVGTLQPAFDWALNEECVTYGECERYRPFVRNGKAVVVIEYGGVSAKRLCRVAARYGLQAQTKHLNLGAWSRLC